MCRNAFQHLIRLILGFIAAIPLANAAVIVEDFNSIAADVAIYTTNLSLNGFRFSPNCHYDITTFNDAGFGDTQFIGFDDSGCGPMFNTDFLGPVSLSQSVNPGAIPALYVDRSGESFSLLSLWVARPFWTVESSNGGIASVVGTDALTTFAFSGPQWTNIDWLLFTIANGTGTPFGFDNLTVAVPEGSTLAGLLILVAFASLIRTRRERFAGL